MSLIQTYFYNEPLKYTGTQLHSHFAYQNFKIYGDSIVAFTGPCDVKTENMVDLEDQNQNLFIFSENMLHFIIEHFDQDLKTTIALQRLLATHIIQEIDWQQPGLGFTRNGDDIFDETRRKLSVSIATASPTSTLIHFGVNISSKNTPVPAIGLDDFQLAPHALATGVMNRYRAEFESLKKAQTKVRGVL